MKKLIVFGLGLVALGFVSCSDSNAPTEPSTAVNKTEQINQDFSGSIYNTCCDEVVTITGTLHGVLKDGKIHVNGQGLVATDEDGNTYHGNITETVSVTETNDGGYCVDEIVNYNFSGPGDCDFSAKVRIRGCVDADGNVTMTQEVYDLTCI
jgi:hypothetical protein